MPNGPRNYVLIAALFAILGMSEACSASTVGRCKAPSRRTDAATLRKFHHTRSHVLRIVLPRADSLRSSPASYVLDDLVEVPDESEDDRGDERKDLIQPTGPSLPDLALEPQTDSVRTALASARQFRERLPVHQDRPRFLSLCRLLI